MRCKECLQDKSSDAFYVSNQKTCKECVKAKVRTNRAARLEYYRDYDRTRADEPQRVKARAEYRRTEAFRISHAAAAKKWDAEHPERKSATAAVNNAIRDGRITPWPVCAVPECDQKPEAHHPAYSLPLDVVWLCDRHHKQVHKEAREILRSEARAL